MYSLLESVCHIDEKDDATKLKEAISLNQRVLKANSQVEWAHYYLGLGYFLKGDFYNSFSHFKEAQKLNYPLGEVAIILLGNYYAREGKRTKEAIETYIKYIRFRTSQVDEDSKRVYSLLESVCHIDENEKDNATKLKEAIALNQRILKANSQVEWAHYYLGLGCFLKGDFNRSFTHLTEAQKHNPNRTAINYYLARTIYFLGKTFLEDGAIENALSAFRESLQLDPNQADASFQVGKILIYQLEGV